MAVLGSPIIKQFISALNLPFPDYEKDLGVPPNNMHKTPFFKSSFPHIDGAIECTN